ncbi:hypothetical protein VA7868_04627 [Vibrio aerogenes CECT 7868]|uniref:Toxin VasX N-terminal region domain-containing protein n=1 Tax=Vibrio aerogenes CECT 7868 TaxID=1216006 RepID=A0A1M6FCJ2_9VIBR|nr:toxin VasX [Vibrio aerogenes]SHI95440.1 hypothetical protein VA7868_04627 [Vibrio aerogenes CECT 7868]
MTTSTDRASNGSTQDVMSPVGTCPYKKHKLQLIPVRYALTEKKTEHKAISSQLKSKVKFRHIGVRPLAVESYIYVIHSRRTDIMYAFKAMPDGSVQKLEQKEIQTKKSGDQEYVYTDSEKALVVDYCGSIEVLYSPMPISPKLQGQLLMSSKLRSRMMQRCPVGSFKATTGAKHLLPPAELADHLADAHPDDSDHEEAYRWCWQTDPVEAVQADTLKANILSTYKDDAAILILEDPIGITTQLASAYISIVNMQNDWYEEDNNRAKHFAATQIKALIAVDKKHFKLLAQDEKIKAYADANPDKLKARYQQYADAYDEYQTYIRNYTLSHSVYTTDIEEIQENPATVQYHSEIALNKSFAEDEIGVPADALKSLFHRIILEQEKTMHGDPLKFTDRGVLDRIREDEMEAWFFDAQQKIQHWSKLTDQIAKDRNQTMFAAYDVIPVFDKENQEALIARLQTENHWLSTIDKLDPELHKLMDFYFKSIGEQNLQIFIGNATNIATLEAHQVGPTEFIQGVTLKGNVDDVLTGIAALTEFREFLQGLNLVELGELSPKVQNELSKHGAYLAGLAVGELSALLSSAKSLQARADELLWRARPGILALMVGQKKNANVKLKAGSAENIPVINKVFDDLFEKRARLEALKTKYNGVHDMKGLSREKADAIRAGYTQEMNQLSAECEAQFQKLGAINEPIVGPNQKHPPSHISVEAGEVQEQAEAILERQRKLLTNEVIFGKAEVDLTDIKTVKALPNGAIVSGSLSFVMLVASYFNWISTRSDMEKRSELTIPQMGEYAAAMLGYASAGVAFGVEIARTISIMAIIKQGATKPLQNIAGGVVAVGNATIAPINFLATLGDSAKQIGRVYHDWKQRDLPAMTGSAFALAGDGIQLWKTGQLTYIGFRVVSDAIAEKITFRMAGEITMRYAAEFNPWMLLATVLIVGGELVHNYLQSTALLHWVSRCEWGKKGWWPGYEYQGWDYKTQLRHWQEVIQAPQLLLETDSVKEKQWVCHGNNAYQVEVELHQLKRFRLIIPMAAPAQVKLAGMMTIAGQKTPEDITTSNLLKYHQLGYDGLKTVYEFTLPLSRKKYSALRYLDLLVEITTPQGNILFADHGGARFTINLMHPEKTSKPVDGNPHHFTASVLGDGDEQVVKETTLKAALTTLQLTTSKGNH